MMITARYKEKAHEVIQEPMSNHWSNWRTIGNRIRTWFTILIWSRLVTLETFNLLSSKLMKMAMWIRPCPKQPMIYLMGGNNYNNRINWITWSLLHLIMMTTRVRSHKPGAIYQSFSWKIIRPTPWCIWQAPNRGVSWISRVWTK